MDRRTPTVSELVRRAVEVSDPDGRDPSELRRLAVRAQWHGDPPTYVADWLGDR